MSLALKQFIPGLKTNMKIVGGRKNQVKEKEARVPEFETVTLSESKPPRTTKQKLKSLAQGALAVTAGVALAVTAAPIAIGAGIGAAVGGAAGYIGESLQDMFSLGFSGVSQESKIDKAKKGAAAGAVIGGAIGGIVSGQALTVAGIAVGGVAALGLAKAGQNMLDRMNPLNW